VTTATTLTLVCEIMIKIMAMPTTEGPTITDMRMVTAPTNISISDASARRSVGSDGSGRLEVIYDGTCAFCTAQARRLAGHLGDRVELVASDSPRVAADRVLASKTVGALVVRDTFGTEWVGADAVARLMRLSPRLSLLGRAMMWPVIRQVSHLGYRAVARVRHRLARWT
jgi:predicted DCC family thiol-disulfide oxidoreductase YuxK